MLSPLGKRLIRQSKLGQLLTLRCGQILEASAVSIKSLVHIIAVRSLYSSLFSPLLSSSLFVRHTANMTFARSITSVLKTSRAGLSLPRGANPVCRVFGHERFGARAYAVAFERTKPHVNVGKQPIFDEDAHG
jgi:hypothetical protein